MKSQIYEPKGITYPALMKLNYDGHHLVVLFKEAGKGTVLIPDSYTAGEWTIGEYRQDWNMTGFIPLQPGSQIILTA